MMTDSTSRLPDGWVTCALRQVTLPVTKINPVDDPNREVHYIDISSIDNDRHTIATTKRFRLERAPSRARQIVHAGDTLFATVRPYLRNIALVPERYNDEIASTGFSVLRPADGICPAFLFYNIVSNDFVNRISGMQYGVSYPAVKEDQVRDMEICLPPTAEQCRIMVKIDELLSTLDNGLDSLQRARTLLDHYRRALLKYAFEGTLTAQWRKENNDRLETPAQLLDRIKRARSACYEQQLQDWKLASEIRKNLGNGGDKPKRRRPSIASVVPRDVLSTLPNLADSWVWGPLAWMTCGVEYGTAAKSASSGKVPVLRMGNIREGRFDWSELVYTSDRDEIRKYFLYDGDVLFNRTNSPELVGKSAIYRGLMPALFAGYLIRINHIPSVVHGEYLNFFLNSTIARQYGRTVKTDGVNQSNISGSKLMKYPFPYCSIDEQRKIVGILNRVGSVVEELERKISKQIDSVTSLRQAILKKALSGQLVAQHTSDEPASVLLERIRAERKQTEKRRAHRKAGRRRTARQQDGR